MNKINYKNKNCQRKRYFILISWDGYPEKFNSWVPASSLKLDENKKNFPLKKK
jgi:hypothetical protein